MIEMELVRTTFLTRWPCHVCGGCTEKVSILCEGHDDSPDRGRSAQSANPFARDGGQVFRVCERCLEDGQDNVDATLKDHADDLETRSRYLRGLIGQVKIPTYAEWEAAMKRANEEEYEARTGRPSGTL